MGLELTKRRRDQKGRANEGGTWIPKQNDATCREKGEDGQGRQPEPLALHQNFLHLKSAVPRKPIWGRTINSKKC